MIKLGNDLHIKYCMVNSLGAITKESTPFLPIDPIISSHFRDPMVFPYQEGLVLLIGACDLNGQGKIVVYFSKDRNVHNFHQLGELTFTDQELGYMVECPNLVFMMASLSYYLPTRSISICKKLSEYLSEYVHIGRNV